MGANPVHGGGETAGDAIYGRCRLVYKHVRALSVLLKAGFCCLRMCESFIVGGT